MFRFVLDEQSTYLLFWINAIIGHITVDDNRTYDDWIHEAAMKGAVEMPICCSVISPWLDTVGTLPSYETKRYNPETVEGDFLFTGPSASSPDPLKRRANILGFVANYMQHQGLSVSAETLAQAITQDKFQYLSACQAKDLSGLPPLLIQVGNEEIMLDESVVFADRARKFGVDVRLEIWPRMWHCFPLFTNACGIEFLPRDGEPSSSAVEEEDPADKARWVAPGKRPLRLLEAWHALHNMAYFVRSCAGTAKPNTCYPTIHSQTGAQKRAFHSSLKVDTRYPVVHSQAGGSQTFEFNKNSFLRSRHVCIHRLFNKRVKAFPCLSVYLFHCFCT